MDRGRRAAGRLLRVSVATAGDVNGDGFDDVVIGAQLHDGTLDNQGRAYVYHGSASGLSDTPAWTAEGEAAGDLFGTTVSTAGDVDGDGYDDVLVSAIDFTDDQDREGRVYLFHGSAGGCLVTGVDRRRQSDLRPLRSRAGPGGGTSTATATTTS